MKFKSLEDISAILDSKVVGIEGERGENVLAEKVIAEKVIAEKVRAEQIRSAFANQLSDMFSDIERTSTRVSDIVMGFQTYSDLRKVGMDTLELETSVFNLKAGFMATLWGATIWVSKMPDTDVVFYGEDDPAFAKDWPSFNRFKNDVLIDDTPLTKDFVLKVLADLQDIKAKLGMSALRKGKNENA